MTDTQPAREDGRATHVSVSLGLTVPHPNIQFMMVRPEISIHDLPLDATDDELEARVQAAVDVAVSAVMKIDDGMGNVVQRLVSPDSPIPGLRSQIAEARELAATTQGQIRRVVDQLRTYDIADLVRRVRGDTAEVVPVRADGDDSVPDEVSNPTLRRSKG